MTVGEVPDQPTAIGYLCIDEADDVRLAELRQEIGAYCARHGLRLVRTYCDKGYDGTQLARPGLVEVRDQLVEAAGLVVVVPSLEHLSPSEVIRQPLERMIQHLGGILAIARETNGTCHDLPADAGGASA